jgi:hypothetical protein
MPAAGVDLTVKRKPIIKAAGETSQRHSAMAVVCE